MNRSTPIIALLLSGCVISMGPPRTKAESLPVGLFDAAGSRVGTAVLTADSAGLTLAFDVFGLPPGPHGVHLHEHGVCEPRDFLSAGSHLDDGERHQHGRLNPAGWHLGDLPNLVVDSAGRAQVSLRLGSRTPGFSSGKVFDRDGSAIIIHAGPDDGMTDPSGGSGARIACGIVA